MIARHSFKCLTIAKSSKNNGAKEYQWTCHSGHNQQFDIQPVGDGSGYNIVVARHSGKYLAVDGSSTNSGIAVRSRGIASAAVY